jgi:hypothetical protein
VDFKGVKAMQLLEFAQRFLNYKAFVTIINQQSGKVEFTGMFMDCPYRFCRFANVIRCEIDKDNMSLILYVVSNGNMYYNTQSHFLNGTIEAE